MINATTVDQIANSRSAPRRIASQHQIGAESRPHTNTELVNATELVSGAAVPPLFFIYLPGDSPGNMTGRSSL
jgi:hypothetical protein